MNTQNDEQVKAEIENYENLINEQIETNLIEVNQETIKNIISNLPNGKSTGFAETNYEMYKYGPIDQLAEILSIIFEKMLKYNVIPYLFNIGKITPVIKNANESNSDINKIRPITISDSLSNIFEMYLLRRMEKTYQDSKTQFGFKSNSSTNHAVFVLDQTIKLYKEKRKSLYICAIDASKAFEKVNRIKLLHSLIGKMDPELWRITKNYYNSNVYIRNCNETGPIFKTSVGVKQGGPLSHRLFSIYVEELIERIKKTNLVAEINSLPTGILMYADDLLIVTDSVDKLKKILKICEKFGDEKEIKFNPKKTQVMSVNSKNNEPKVELCGQEIE